MSTPPRGRLALGVLVLGVTLACAGCGSPSGATVSPSASNATPEAVARIDSPDGTPDGQGARAAGSDIGGSASARREARQPSGAPESRATSALPGSNSVRQPWRYGEADGVEITTEHFRFLTTVRDERVLSGLPVLMEGALRHYCTALGPLPWPQRRVDSYIFERRTEWADRTRELLGRNAGPYLSMGRGGYTTDAQTVLFNLGRTDTFTLSIHEGWHQYTQATFRDTLPVWLEEGIACYMEGHRFRRSDEGPVFMPWRNMERYGELRSAARAGQLFDLDRILNGSPQTFLNEGRRAMLVYYAQVWALTMFLAEGEGGCYRDALHTLVRDAAEGRFRDTLSEGGGRRRGVSPFGRSVIRAYFNTNVDEFTAQYERFIEQILSSSSGTAVWRGQSPLESSG